MLALGPLAIVSIVLVVAGVWKVLRPDEARSALRTLGVPVPPVAVRLVGVGEAALGALTLVVGGWVLATAVGVLYLVFAGVAWRLRDGEVGCGCFGAASSTPPGILHVVVNLVAAAVALIAVLADVPGHVEAWSELPGAGLPHVLLVIVGAIGTLGVLTVLPDARAAVDGHVRAPQSVLFQPRRPARSNGA
jgi:hypothetical protein